MRANKSHWELNATGLRWGKFGLSGAGLGKGSLEGRNAILGHLASMYVYREVD